MVEGAHALPDPTATIPAGLTERLAKELIGGSTTWPFAASAQQSVKVKRVIGV